MHEHVASLRRFNRSFTQRIGVLDDSFLGSGRPLGPSRLLYEIGPDGAGILELRARLGLDSGYVSRLLRQLESEGLITVTTDPADGRRRTARLTDLGREQVADLDRRSDELAERLVSPLSPRRREQLSQALATADRLSAPPPSRSTLSIRVVTMRLAITSTSRSSTSGSRPGSIRRHPRR